jgi:hypothetical protein
MILIGDKHMSWISDVRSEINQLDMSKKNLKKFAFLVGLVLLIMALALKLRIILGIPGLLLIGLGFSFPAALKPVYKVWMGLSFAIGWIISRLILIILFFLVISPIGMIIRLMGIKPIDIDIKGKKDSYWIHKNQDKKANYEKMY